MSESSKVEGGYATEETLQDVVTAIGTISLTEVATAADGGALPAEVKVVGGYDGLAVQAIHTDASGDLQIDVLSSALPTGAATEASLASVDGKLPALSGGRVPVDGSGVTQPVSAASLPLPMGAATEATLSALDAKVTAVNTGAVVVSSSALPTGAATEATLSTLNGKVPSQGQAAMAASVPVVIASNQTAVPASQSGTWNIADVTGTVSLPTGAATSANQSTANTSLSNLETYTNRTPRNASATDSTAASATGAAETESAPADAVGFILSADGANTDSIRYRLGGTASATAGHELEPGRDSGYIPCAATISIFAVSGTQTYQLTWIRR